MSNMAHDGLPLTPEQQAAQLLAYYDARQVPDAKLRKIFSCTDEALNSARKSDDYQAYIAAETDRIEEQARTVDELWNNLEAQALGDLRDAMDTVADARQLLGIAVQANKAGRRAGQFGAQKTAASPVINTDQLAGPDRTVRLRTRFLEQLSSPDGTARLIERTAEVTEFTRGGLDEHMDPATVKHLLQSALGIDTRGLKVARTMGHDDGVVEGTFLDFTNVPIGTGG